MMNITEMLAVVIGSGVLGLQLALWVTERRYWTKRL